MHRSEKNQKLLHFLFCSFLPVPYCGGYSLRPLYPPLLREFLPLMKDVYNLYNNCVHIRCLLYYLVNKTVSY